MESKTGELVIVYPCPYCSDLVWHNRKEELAYHIYKEHLKVALELLADKCKQYAQKKNMKWCLGK